MSTLKFGFADEIITPQLNGQFLDGYGYRLTPVEYVRDDLHAKVCAIESDGQMSLLFSLDLLGMSPRNYQMITSLISFRTGGPRERIALCFIHTHAAPAVGILDILPIDQNCLAHMGELCSQAALRAMERVCPGCFDFAILPEQITRSYNRRPGGSVIDRSIRAAAFRDETGKLRGVLSSASCHAVVCTKHCFSADWLSELNKISSDELPYLYIQNRGADIDPAGMAPENVETLIEALGKELSVPVERFAKESRSLSPLEGSLHVCYENVRLPMLQMRDIAEMDANIKEQQEIYFSLPLDNWQKQEALVQIQFWQHMKELAEKGESNDITVPLQLFSLNRDFVFAFLPFEVLTLTGNKLEEMFAAKGFPREAIYVCGYSNSTNGYLAPVEEFAVGGYEVAGAAHWYNISQNCPETEPAVLEWFAKQAEML